MLSDVRCENNEQQLRSLAQTEACVVEWERQLLQWIDEQETEIGFPVLLSGNLDAADNGCPINSYANPLIGVIDDRAGIARSVR